MDRFFLEIAYNGTDFHGWQTQENAHTVQAEVEKALTTLLRINTPVTGCGRTDTGVHAEQYFLHFDTDQDIAEWMVYKFNQLTPQSIAALSLRRVDGNAHARFDADSRSYRYDIHSHKSPFLQDKSAFVHYSLDEKKLNEASKLLLGSQDFGAFCKSGSDNKTNICDVTEAYWTGEGGVLHFHITADRFLRNMVRAIVGTLIDVGRGKMTVKEFQDVIASRDRSTAGKSADACGLYLTKVTYPFL